MKIENKYLRKIMVEMCKRAGTTLKNTDMKKVNWFRKHSWTQKQEEAFVDWMIDYLYENYEARQIIMDNPMKNKKQIKEAVSMFVFNYGWTTKESNAKSIIKRDYKQ